MGRESITVANEVWIATSELQKKNPNGTFSVNEIVDKVFELKLTPTLRPGVQIHVSTHVVANARPNPNNLRYLYKTQDGKRRLFRKGDDYHKYRQGTKIRPDEREIPVKYKHLIKWYDEVWSG